MNILFFIQIILESLPISSSHHLKIIRYFSTATTPLPLSDMLFSNLFTLIILIIAFFKPFFRWIFYYSFNRKIYDFSCILLANGITFLFFIVNHFLFKNIDLTDNLFFGCFVNSLLLSSFYKGYLIKGDRNFIVPRDGIILGIAQGIALCFSGVSRLGSTLLVGLFLGYSAEYSLAISVALQSTLCLGIVGCLGLNSIFNLTTLSFSPFNHSDFSMVVLSCIVSYLFLKLFVHYYLDKKIWYLSAYSFCLGAILFICQIFIYV